MKAFHAGKQFEQIFSHVASNAGLTVVRIPDGCRVVGRNKLIRVKSPFDYILAKPGKVAFIDTKTFAANRCAINNPKLFEPHQIGTLSRFCELGIQSGFLIWFRKSDELGFIDADFLQKNLNEGYKSISIKQCFYIGKLLDPNTINFNGLF